MSNFRERLLQSGIEWQNPQKDRGPLDGSLNGVTVKIAKFDGIWAIDKDKSSLCGIVSGGKEERERAITILNSALEKRGKRVGKQTAANEEFVVWRVEDDLNLLDSMWYS